MFKSSSLTEAANLLDSIIDDSLDCQERMLRDQISQLPDFATCLEKIITLKNKVSAQFYNQLETLISSLRPPKITPPPSFGSSQSEILLPFFTDALQSEYDTQTDSFKDLVAKGNPLIPLYISVLKMTGTKLNSSLMQLQSVLQNNY